MNLYHRWWVFERIQFPVLRNSHKICKYLFSFCGENCHVQSWVVLCTTIQQLRLRIAKLFSWIFFLYILVMHSIHTNSRLTKIENKSDAINPILFKEIFLSHFKHGMRSHSKVLWWYWDYLGGLDTNYIRCLTVVYYVDVGPAVSTRFSTRAWFLHHCSSDLGYRDTALGWLGVLGGWRQHSILSYFVSNKENYHLPGIWNDGWQEVLLMYKRWRSIFCKIQLWVLSSLQSTSTRVLNIPRSDWCTVSTWMHLYRHCRSLSPPLKPHNAHCKYNFSF
jgi:hypothetical protein